MDNENLRDIRMAGSGTVAGGKYATISISGSGTIDGDVECGDMTIGGSGTILGNAKTANLRVGGSGRIEGSLEAENARFSGSGRVQDDLTARGEVKISGSASVGGTLKAETVSVSGSVKVGRDIECESLQISGNFTVGGLVNAGKLELTPNGLCTASELGGDEILVKQPHESSFILFGMNFSFKKPSGKLVVGVIEANRVELCSTEAKVVRGDAVEIGPDCKIERVEYRESLQIAEGAQVLEQIKL